MSFTPTIRADERTFRKMRKTLKKAGAAGIRLAKFELTRQAGLTLAVAADRAPRDLGLLKQKVKVIPAKVIRNATGPAGGLLPSFIRAGFVFLQKYAEVQHENLTYRHEEGEAKYAENALKARQRAIIGGVARALGRLGRRL